MTAMVETLSIAPEFEGAARVGLLEIDGVRVQESHEELKTMLNRLADEFAGRYKDHQPGEIPMVKQIRAIFHRSGLDPTRYRPSSESLLRRAVKGKGLYFINSVVDLINYFSLKTLWPIGLWVTFSPAGASIPHDEFAEAMMRFNGGVVKASTQL